MTVIVVINELIIVMRAHPTPQSTSPDVPWEGW